MAQPMPAAVALDKKAAQEKLDGIICKDGLAGELQCAKNFVVEKVPWVYYHETLFVILPDRFIFASEVFHRQPLKVTKTPLGKNCGIVAPGDIKQKCGSHGRCLASGTLAQLNLNADAIGTFDTATISMVMNEARYVQNIADIVGEIVINIDTSSQDLTHDLHRVDKDGCVQALCLLIYWHKDNTQALGALIEYASDMVFMFKRLGTGHCMTCINIIMASE